MPQSIIGARKSQFKRNRLIRRPVATGMPESIEDSDTVNLRTPKTSKCEVLKAGARLHFLSGIRQWFSGPEAGQAQAFPSQ